MNYDELVYDLSEYITHEQKMLELHLQIEFENECKMKKWKEEQKNG